MLIIINVTNSTITGIKIQSFSLKSSDLILNKWQNYLKRIIVLNSETKVLVRHVRSP